MQNQDIRWQQRFQNYTRAVSLVEEALSHGASALSQLEKEGLIQRYEFTVELAWKTMKDYLESSGILLDTITPKSVIAAAWQAKIIPDGQVWVDMLAHRNMLSHRYDATAVDAVAEALEATYLAEFQHLRDWLTARIERD